MRARRQRQAGFTLMEILIALGIFVIAAVSIMSLFMVATSTHKRAVDATRAGMLAETLLSEIDTAARTQGAIRAVSKKTPHPDYPGMTYTIELKEITPDEHKVVVVIHWKREGKDREQRFDTVVLASEARGKK